MVDWALHARLGATLPERSIAADDLEPRVIEVAVKSDTVQSEWLTMGN